MSGLSARSVPAPGQAPLVAPNAAALLRRNAGEFGDRVAIKFGDRAWTHAEYFEESCRFAALFLERLPADGPRHVAVLLDNTPDYLFAFGGAALIGAAIVGLNHTRRDEHLLRDVQHTHCGLVLTEPRHEALLAPIADGLPPMLSSDRFAEPGDPAPALGESFADALRPARRRPPIPASSPTSTRSGRLIFTSGTSDAPKAVICSQRRLLVTGKRMTMLMDLGPDDIGYVCMPLFHSNAVQVGWAPSLVAPCAVGLGRRFSASRWLADIRHYGSTYFNYTGKPLAYLLAQPEARRRRRQPVARRVRQRRIAGGRRQLLAAVRRGGDRRVRRDRGRRRGEPRRRRCRPARSAARPTTCRSSTTTARRRPRADLDERGRVRNAEECVGEIVNTQGVGPFEGYYNNEDATAKTTRFGWYWSGDLGYKDPHGFLYFAGRNADWIRVDGENFPAGPIEEALRKAPGVVLAAVYGVPDDQAGDQVMAGLVLADGAAFDPIVFARWLDAQDGDRSEVAAALRADPARPADHRHQQDREAHAGAPEVPRRSRRAATRATCASRGEAEFRPFTDADEAVLHASFVRYGRERFWDL